jgi:hypothetical protein
MLRFVAKTRKKTWGNGGGGSRCLGFPSLRYVTPNHLALQGAALLCGVCMALASAKEAIAQVHE